MSYVLIPVSSLPHTIHLFAGAVAVDVCNEDGTVHDSRFFCPTCSLRSRDE